MKVIIAGSRTIKDMNALLYAIKLCPFDITEVVCGMAYGPDTLGKQWAEERGIPVIECPAKWDIYGRSAGPIRNKEMAKIGDALVALYDGESSGTRNMMYEMNILNKPVLMVRISHMFYNVEAQI